LQLHAQLLPYGYDVKVNWYDWRKQMLPVATEFADRIRREVTAADPCTLVGHSHGGIISRVAWSLLLATEETNLIRRIISLGTAHAGSYAAVELLSTGGSMVDGLLSWNQRIGDIAWGAFSWVGYRRWTRQELIDLTATWPAIYEVLPVLDAWESEDDVHRPLLFDKDNWKGDTALSQDWLTHSKDVIGPLMRSATTRPPGHIMTCVGSNNHTTKYTLEDPELLGLSGGLGETEEGDGTVWRQSAFLPGALCITVNSAHADLMPQTVNAGLLRAWILQQRSPSPDPPEPQVIRTPMPQSLPDIPGGAADGQSIRAADCEHGRCVC
jgi:hypothetical protein